MLRYRELEVVGKAQSQAGQSTTLPQAPAETPLTSSSHRPQSPTPIHVNHDTETFNNEPMTQTYNSTGFFPPDPAAVAIQNWYVCDLQDPRIVLSSNASNVWRPAGHDFLPQLTAWLLQRLPLYPDQATRSCSRVNRMMMHIDIEEIRDIIRKQKKKRKSLLATLAELSSYQQLQITRLIEDLQQFDFSKGATWTFTLQALLTQPKGKLGRRSNLFSYSLKGYYNQVPCHHIWVPSSQTDIHQNTPQPPTAKIFPFPPRLILRSNHHFHIREQLHTSNQRSTVINIINQTIHIPVQTLRCIITCPACHIGQTLKNLSYRMPPTLVQVLERRRRKSPKGSHGIAVARRVQSVLLQVLHQNLGIVDRYGTANQGDHHFANGGRRRVIDTIVEAIHLLLRYKTRLTTGRYGAASGN